MTIRFIPIGVKNYNKDNIKEIIANINDPIIQSALSSEEDEIQVKGDIHASQLTFDNPDKLFWFRISVHDKDGQMVIGYSSIHIFVCFRLMEFKKGRFYPSKQCIIPSTIKGTDMPDISNLFGFWEFRKITYGIIQQLQENTTVLINQLPKRVSKAIKIIDPKTGKPIQL